MPRAEARILEVFICAKDLPCAGMIEQDHKIPNSGPKWRLTEISHAIVGFLHRNNRRLQLQHYFHKTAAESRRSFSTLAKAI